MPLDTSIPLQIGRAPQVQALDPMTMYNAMQERQMNALRAQALQQTMAQNALAMQNTMEDRRAAAAKAAQERAALARRRDIFSRFGTTDAAIGQRGVGYSGTGVDADPYAYVRNQLIKTGDLSAAEDIAKVQKEQLAGEESKAKIPGLKAVSSKQEVELADAQLKQFGMNIDRAPTIEAVDMLFDSNPAAVMAAGSTPDKSKAMFRQRVVEVGFDRARMEVANGVMAVQKQFSDQYKTLETPQGYVEYTPGKSTVTPLTLPSGQAATPVDRRSVTNIDMKGEGAFAGELGKLEAADVMKGRAAAEDARSILDTINTGRALLDKGVISGFGADFKLGFAKAAKELGASGFDGKIENTESYASNMAQNVGKLIKQFGAGTGLSDTDRKFAEQMAGGQISLDEKSMRKILDISDRAARNVILAHNKRVEGVQSKTGLTVEMPPTTAAAVNSAGGTSVTTPDGKVFSFPTPEAAAQFKKAAGIP
jgi:hypothetical protein